MWVISVLVYLEREDEQKELSFSGDVKTLLEELSINREEVLVVRGETILTDNDTVVNGDEIRILSVISGG